MEEYVLRTYAVTKIYEDSEVVSNVHMHIKKGEIYGIIGRNGAGKSTLMRIIAGVVLPNRGTIELFEEDRAWAVREERQRVGVLIEGPAYYSELTATQNMEIIRRQKGIPGKGCIEEKLEWVGLKDTGKKKVKDFSLGMKQKLGIAMALLGDPEFLILDEPNNGLDAVGIVQMRELFKRLNEEQGVTILISSHILEELHQLATNYGMLHEGRLIQEISRSELEEKCKRALALQVDDLNHLAWLLENKLQTTQYKVISTDTIHIYDYVDNPGKVIGELLKEGIHLTGVTTIGDTLENYFLQVLGGGAND